MTYTKPVIEKWNAVLAIQDSTEKPGSLSNDAPITAFVGTVNAYQADE